MAKEKRKTLDGDSKTYLIFFIIGFIVLTACAGFIIHLKEEKVIDFLEGVSVESFGMLMDLFILGFMFHHFKEKGDKRKEEEEKENERQLKIERYKEEIDDFRGWESDEAKFRIVGILKRLKKITDEKINLTRCYFSGLNKLDLDFSNTSCDVTQFNKVELRKSNFSNTTIIKSELVDAKMHNSLFYRTNFTESSLRNITFSGSSFYKAVLTFADLEEAKFDGAMLIRSDLSHVNHAPIAELLKAKSLYKTKFDDRVFKLINDKKPELFYRPDNYEEILKGMPLSEEDFNEELKDNENSCNRKTEGVNDKEVQGNIKKVLQSQLNLGNIDKNQFDSIIKKLK